MKTCGWLPGCSQSVWGAADLPGVEDAQDKYHQSHNTLGVPPLQVRRCQDWLLCANDHHSCLVLDLQGGQRGGHDLMEDAQQAGVTRSVWEKRNSSVCVSTMNLFLTFRIFTITRHKLHENSLKWHFNLFKSVFTPCVCVDTLVQLYGGIHYFQPVQQAPKNSNYPQFKENKCDIFQFELINTAVPSSVQSLSLTKCIMLLIQQALQSFQRFQSFSAHWNPSLLPHAATTRIDAHVNPHCWKHWHFMWHFNQQSHQAHWSWLTRSETWCTGWWWRTGEDLSVAETPGDTQREQSGISQSRHKTKS